MKKNQSLKEALIATLLILLVTYLVSFFSWSLEYGKAFHQGWADFDIYDLYYSGNDKYLYQKDTNIVIVELGETRSEIASQIKLVAQYQPKVIGIDVLLESPRPNDPYDQDGDDSLSAAIRACRAPVVMSYRITADTVVIPNYFIGQPGHIQSGYINFDGEEHSVIRSYSPSALVQGHAHQSFTTRIAAIADKKGYSLLQEKKQQHLLINYSGNLDNYVTITRKGLHELEKQAELERVIKNKLVILGYFVHQNEKFQPPLVLEDLHFTPFNEVVSGKSFPDMYGVVIHANILSMILHNHYAMNVPLFFSYLFAFLISFGFNLALLSQYHRNHELVHALFILFQILLILVVLFMFLEIFSLFLWKVRLEPIMVSLVLSLEMLGLYKFIAIFLHKKFGYKTVFIHK
jgi:CHASE2 domain-containing sensor protein